MEFIIVLIMFAVPIIAAAMGNKKASKTVVYKKLDSDTLRRLVGEGGSPDDEACDDTETDTTCDDKPEYNSAEGASPLGTVPTEGLPALTPERIAQSEKAEDTQEVAAAATHDEKKDGFFLSDEEKKKMIIYSEILKPKFED
ncbi:unknown [Bacteroides sp. CAG:1060]|nr:unknown [Bacteroides sp. CAG:1060]